MPILVPSDESNNIEVSISYIDRGASGVKIFDDEEEKTEWIERETERRNSKRVELTAAGDPIPDSLREEAKEDVKELKTWWKRADWGTQSSIVHSAQSVDSQSGETSTDWTKYRLEQMKSLMVGWSLKTSEGDAVPISETILKRMDYNVALTLINLYEKKVSPDEDEFENLG